MNLPTKVCKKYSIIERVMLNYPLSQVESLTFLERTKIGKLCACISNSRVMYLPKYFISNPNILKFKPQFNVSNKNQLINNL